MLRCVGAGSPPKRQWSPDPAYLKKACTGLFRLGIVEPPTRVAQTTQAVAARALAKIANGQRPTDEEENVLIFGGLGRL
jgi:hypothetical protein